MTNSESANQSHRTTVDTAGGTYNAGNIDTGGGDLVNRDKITYIGGEPVHLPSRADWIAYLQRVQMAYARWADQPEQPQPPLYEQSDDPDHGPDSYIDLRATLPMRVAEFRPRPDGQEAEAQELLIALDGKRRTIILGEPGSGKTTALERLAWVTATQALAQAGQEQVEEQEDEQEQAALPPIPIVVRLADYQGEADLVALICRSLNRLGSFPLSEPATKVILHDQRYPLILLLDGLNEFPQVHQSTGPATLRGHSDNHPHHTIHLTCRTADFDAALQPLPDTTVWTVQPLVDTIRYWGDKQGESDLRTYLRRHLGDGAGERLYDRLRADERLHTLAQLPLFLWMFKETGGDGGELPADRGTLIRQFVRGRRLLQRVPQAGDLRDRAERSLEAIGRHLQEAGTLELSTDTLMAILADVRGPLTYPLETMVDQLQRTGLLIDLGDGRRKLLHQLIQEYAAAAHLVRQADCGEVLPRLAADEWWRETLILALWLRKALHTPAYLLGLMNNPTVDLRVRITAAQILGQVGDPRFVVQTAPTFRGRATPNPPQPPIHGPSPERPRSFIEPTLIPIPAGTAILGGDDPDGYDNEKPACSVPIAAFELAQFPVTNREYSYFIDAGGYDDESLWTTAGQGWLRGEGKLDAETEEQYRQIHRVIANDVEGVIAQLKQTLQLSEQGADNYRIFAGWTEDEYIEYYNDQILGEQRREPFYWRDGRFNNPTQPVVGVNWYEALAYATWLSRVTGKRYCLPTEAQWEWAARRKGQLPRQDWQFWRRPPRLAGRRYPWGDAWDPERANASETRLGQPNPVGVYPHGATADGLHELAGNVYEWTLSLYRDYPYDPTDGREDPEADGLRVYRGGSWYVSHSRLRCAYRFRNNPWNRDNFVGYRLARLLSPAVSRQLSGER